MRKKLLILGLCSLIGVALVSSALAQGDKIPFDTKPWSLNAITPVNDVNEDEGVNNACPGQAFNCGDAYHGSIPVGGLSGDSDYFHFDVTAGTVITFWTAAEGTSPVGDTYIYLHDPTCTQVAYNDDAAPGNYYSTLTYVAAVTGTYTGRVRSYGSNNTGTYVAYVTCVAPEPPPLNDTCSGAFDIPCGDINLSGSMQWANNDYNLTPPSSCTGWTVYGRDVVYKFMVGPGAVINATYTSTLDAAFYIVTDCTNPNGSCVVGADATVQGQPEVINYTFATGGTYYLILDAYTPVNWGTWTLVGTLSGCPVSTNTRTWGSVKNMYR